MKSNKQRYQEHMGKRSGGGGQGGGGMNGAAWVIVFIALFALLYSTRAMWMSATGLSTDDLTIGEGKPIPDADEISKHFR
jgi:hypothetical protein